MARCGGDEDDDLAGFDPPITMDHSDAEERPARRSFLDMPGDLAFGHAGIVLERQCRDRRAVFVGAANAGEGHDGADIGPAPRHRRGLGGDVEGFTLQTDRRAHLACSSGTPRRKSLYSRMAYSANRYPLL